MKRVYDTKATTFRDCVTNEHGTKNYFTLLRFDWCMLSAKLVVIVGRKLSLQKGPR